MNNKKETTQKHLTANQLIEAVQNADITKGEAVISIIKKANDEVHLKWKGSSKALLDITYTMLQNDMHIAAIVCRATKDYIDSLKATPQKWMELTQRIAGFDGTRPSSIETSSNDSEGKEAGHE